MAGNNLTILKDLDEARERIGPDMEKILGRGLNQPFNPSNSGARKLLASSQSDQVVPIEGSEVSIVSTGYENRYGERSSSIEKAIGDYKVIKIIDKYSFKPRYHYWVVVYDETNDIYRFYEVKHHKHISERHGYKYNTEYMDSICEGDNIPRDTIMRKSTSYDQYNNRMDGINAMCLYCATERNTEDSVIVNSDICEKMAYTQLKKTEFVVNHNCRMLNRYGDEKTWKSFPDIGETVKNGIFCSVREANKKEELYTLSYNRLKEPLTSDDNTIMPGKVVSIDVFSNDPSALNTFYNVQLKKYYDETMRVAIEFASLEQSILSLNPNATFEGYFKDFLYIQRRIANGDKFTNDGREFNNVYIRVMVEEKKPLDIGDKVADRYGGKGVVSLILPPFMMPRNEDGEVVDMVINQSTCVNRENPGQLFEMELTYISHKIVSFIKTGVLSSRESADIILQFYEIVSPIQYEFYKEYFDYIETKDPDFLDGLIMDIIEDGYIYISVRPILDNMTEDKLELLYDTFPFIKQEYLDITIKDSNGNPRVIKSRRKAIASKKYMYRLKQVAEEKFSATSLSATNIKNLNTKSKQYKRYHSFHSNTPIAMGTMESDDLSSIGQELVIANLMMNSVSPKGRRLMKEALIGDPFTLDIQLDSESTNRNVEILNTYQKEKGVALVFKKIKRKVNHLLTRVTPPAHVKQLVNRVDETPEAILDIYNEEQKRKDRPNQLLVAELVSDSEPAKEEV